MIRFLFIGTEPPVGKKKIVSNYKSYVVVLLLLASFNFASAKEHKAINIANKIQKLNELRSELPREIIKNLPELKIINKETPSADKSNTIY